MADMDGFQEAKAYGIGTPQKSEAFFLKGNEQLFKAISHCEGLKNGLFVFVVDYRRRRYKVSKISRGCNSFCGNS